MWAGYVTGVGESVIDGDTGTDEIEVGEQRIATVAAAAIPRLLSDHTVQLRDEMLAAGIEVGRLVSLRTDTATYTFDRSERLKVRLKRRPERSRTRASAEDPNMGACWCYCDPSDRPSAMGVCCCRCHRPEQT